MWSGPGQLHLLDWGAASPDGVYRRAMVRDDCTYRVWGQLGNASYFSLDFRQSNPKVTLTRSDIEVDFENNFEIFLGGDSRKGQWFPLYPGTSGITTREFFDDWRGAKRSRLRIECLDHGSAPPSEYNPARIAAAFDVVSDWILEGGVRFWMNRSTELEGKALNRFSPELARTETKLPVTSTGLWRLAPDEALVIEFQIQWPTSGDCNWLLRCGTRLTTPIDLRASIRLSWIRTKTAMFRVVLSHRDPGLYNWLDTMGLEHGIMILRLCGAAHASVPAHSSTEDSRHYGRTPRRTALLSRRTPGADHGSPRGSRAHGLRLTWWTRDPRCRSGDRKRSLALDVKTFVRPVANLQ